MKILLVAFSICVSFSGAAGPSCQHDSKNLRCVKYIRNYDGDTVTFEIAGVHPLLGTNLSVRVQGVDTPEMTGKEECEKKKAREARDYVRRLLLGAKRIDLENVARGKYFRVLADIRIDGQSLTESLLRKGLGRPYDGGKKDSRSWCDAVPDASKREIFRGKESLLRGSGRG